MEKVIKKAQEGGYDNSLDIITENSIEVWFKSYILDPLFFQALGKSCGWDFIKIFSGERQGQTKCEHKHNSFLVSKNCGKCYLVGDEFIFYALRFHEINLTESFEKAVEYLLGIIKR